MIKNFKIYLRSLIFYPVLLIFVLIISIKFILPKTDTYQNQVESLVSDYMGYSIETEQVNIEWKSWTPNLSIVNARLFKHDFNNEIIKFDSIEVGINIAKSLTSMKITPSYILVSGINLNIYRDIHGEISIDNNIDINSNEVNDETTLLKWLFAQNHLILKDINLSWTDTYLDKKRVDLNNVNLNFKIYENNLIINLTGNLAKQENNKLIIDANINKNHLTKKWDGEINIEMIDIDPTKLFNKLSVLNAAGVANTKLSTQWENSKLINFSGNIGYSNFSLVSDKSEIFFKNINFDLDGNRKQQKNWLINLDLKNLETDNGIWPNKKYAFEIIKNPLNNNYQLVANLPFLKLRDVLPLIITGDFISNEMLKKIDLNLLSGDINDLNLKITLNESNKIEIERISAIFKKLDIASFSGANSIANLSGQLIAIKNSIDIDLDSNFTKLKYRNLYSEEKVIAKINGNLSYNNDSKNELLINNLDIIYNEISSTSNGKIIFHKNSPLIDIIMNLNESNIEYMASIIPDMENPKLHTWLNDAILGGKITSGKITYKGIEHAESFMDNFSITANITETNIDYDEEWPPIDNIEAEIRIIDNNLSSKIISGKIFDTNINASTVFIDNLSGDNQNIIISTNGYTNTNDLENFIKQSPLRKNGTFLKQINNINGNLYLYLNLDIPLGPEEVTFDGYVSLENNSIKSTFPKFNLKDVNGDIYFSKESLHANNIDATYSNIPIKLNIPTTEYQDLTVMPFEISLLANESFIFDRITTFFPKLEHKIDNLNNYFSGESIWNLAYGKNISGSDSSENVIKLTSNLTGLTIKLPEPLTKNSDQVKVLELLISFNNSPKYEINMKYDDLIFSDIFIEDEAVKNINIGFGAKHPKNNMDNNISIIGNLENLNLSDWGKLFDNKNSEINNAKKYKKIIGKVTIGNFEILDNKFNDVDLAIKNINNNSGWVMDFDSKKINGKAKYNKKTEDNDGYLDLNLKKLSLDKENNNKKLTYDINNFPELNINVTDFIYKGNKLGKLKIKTTNTTDMIVINELSFFKPGFTINANGNWSNIANINKSEFHISFESKTIKLMLDTFNYDAANIDDGKTSIELNANWNDAPMNYKISNLNGNLSMNIEKGQFLDIEPKAGRLFGLLSIQALPRRLSLDFADFFDKGFAFDNIKGNFNIENGQAYTNNLQMIGPAGDIMISGRTGLDTEDYDQIATVVPKFSDSLPVASALFGPVGVGVGAVIYFAGELFESIPSNIDKILSQQYSIKGRWSDPEIEKINIKK